MTEAARKLLATLDSLPEPARQEVITEILRRAALAEYKSPSDDELIAAADEIFQDLDRRESQE